MESMVYFFTKGKQNWTLATKQGGLLGKVKLTCLRAVAESWRPNLIMHE